MKKRKTIIEVQYFPCVAWMTWACKAGEVWLDGGEHYNKRTLRNKALLTQSANQVSLSIPLQKGKHSGKLVTDVQISFAEKWVSNHTGALQSMYGKAPYFIHYMDAINSQLRTDESGLFEFNRRIILLIIDLLKLQISIKKSSDFIKTSNNEYLVLRDQFKLKGDFSVYEDEINKRILSEIKYTHLPFNLSPRSSVLDLLFYLGPETRLFLNKLTT